MIKNAINVEHRGRVLSWEKHQQVAAQRELEAAIRGSRSLPQNNVGLVHNFQDILTVELHEYLPGSSYLRRRADRKLPPLSNQPKEIIGCKSNFIRRRRRKNESSSSFADPRPLLTASKYTLMTLPTDPQSDQTRSHVPVLQCRGKI